MKRVLLNFTYKHFRTTNCPSKKRWGRGFKTKQDYLSIIIFEHFLFFLFSGAVNNCEWYGKDITRCTKSGYTYANYGLTPSQACCACGGGIENGNKLISIFVGLMGIFLCPSPLPKSS